MSDDTLENFIRQFIEANDLSPVTFVWHGGEPLLAGMDFYRKAVRLQRKYAQGKEIENTIQTNGMLLDEEWCRFFRDERFLVGISIDGPEAIHDRFRRDREYRPSFGKVMQAIDSMPRHGVEFNTLTAVNRENEQHGAEVYRFLKSIGSRYLQFLPVVEAVGPSGGSTGPAVVAPGTPDSRIAEWSVTPGGYGRFLVDVYEDWIRTDVGNYFVQAFDAALCQWYGVPPGVCSMSETCGEALVVEADGAVFPCDHFVYTGKSLGNLFSGSLLEFYRSPDQFAFGIEKRNSLPQECLGCRFYFACRGECPKHRFIDAGDGWKNYLCESFRFFFNRIEPDMTEMCRLIDEGRAPAEIMRRK